jgi:hypothetical protein
VDAACRQATLACEGPVSFGWSPFARKASAARRRLFARLRGPFKSGNETDTVLNVAAIRKVSAQLVSYRRSDSAN